MNGVSRTFHSPERGGAFLCFDWLGACLNGMEDGGCGGVEGAGTQLGLLGW